MGTKRTILELQTVGGDKVKVDLNQIGEAGQRAFQRIIDSSKPVSANLAVVDASVHQLRERFNEFANELGPASPILRALGPGGLLAAGAIGAGVGFFELTHKALETAAAIGEAADKIGFHTQTLQELQFAARQTGVDQDKLTTALGIFSQRVGEARGGSLGFLDALNKESVAAGDASEATKRQNRELFESVRNARDADEAFGIYSKAIADAGSETDKAALAAAGFGRQGRAVMLPFLKDGAEGLASFAKEAHSVGVVLSDDMIKSAREADEKLKALGDVIKLNLTAALVQLAPYIAQAAEGLTHLAVAGAQALGYLFGDPARAAAAQKDLAGIAAEIQKVDVSIEAVKNRGPILDALNAITGESGEAEMKRLVERRRDLLELYQSVAFPEEKPKAPTLEKLATAEEKAANTKFLSERKAALAELQSIEDTAAKEGQTKRQAALAQQEIELRKVDDLEKKRLVTAEEAGTARTAIEEGTQRKITQIVEEESKKRAEAEKKVNDIFAENEAKLTEIGQTESEKRLTTFQDAKRKQIEAVQQAYQAEIDAHGSDYQSVLEQQTAAVQHAADQQDAIWTKSEQHRHDAMLSINKELISGLNGVITGILQGTRSGEQILGAFKDVGIGILGQIFTKTLENKLSFDDEFKVNFLTDLPGVVQHGASAILGIFGGLFDAILGQKSGFDSAFGNLFENSGATGAGTSGVTGGFGTSVAGAAGAVGGGLLGSKLGGTAGGIVGSLLGSILTSNAFSVATTGALTPTTAAVIAKLSPTLATYLGQATVAAAASQVGTGSTIGMTLADGTVIQATGTAAGIGAASGASGGGAAAGGIGAAGLAAGYVAAAVIAAVIVDQILTRTGARTSRSETIRAGAAQLDSLTKPTPVKDLLAVFSGHGGDLKFKDTLKNTFSELLGVGPVIAALGAPSRGQSSRRFLGNEVLGNLSSISTLGPTLNFDPYKSGVTSIEKAIAAYPDLFKAAGGAATAFGTVLAASVKSGQSDAKEFNFIVSTLIDNLGRAKVSGPDAVNRIAASFRELNITTEQAGASIQQAFDQGKISQDQYQAALVGLAQVAQVTTEQMVATLKAKLSGEAVGIFNRMTASGIDAFQAVTAAGKDSWLKIAGSMQNDLLPRALAIYQTLVSMGVTSAEAIAAAFGQAFNFTFPEVGGVPGGGVNAAGQFFLGSSGGLVFGSSDAAGHFVPGAAPATTPQEQQKLRGDLAGGQRIPGFALGGIVGGPRGSAQLAVVHGGETVLPSGREGMADLATAIGKAVARHGGTGQRIVVVPVVDRDELQRTLYRLQRENRYILPQTGTEKPVGIR